LLIALERANYKLFGMSEQDPDLNQAS
jgi:hypothetical protein